MYLEAAELDLVLAGFKDCVLDARPRLSVAELGEFMPKGSEVLKARRAAQSLGQPCSFDRGGTRPPGQESRDKCTGLA